MAPPPVERYLARAGLGAESVRLVQHGELRTGAASNRWLPFEATHDAGALHARFHWRARVRLLGPLAFAIEDRLDGGIGSGEVRFLGIRVDSDRDNARIDAACLHRYLAEAVWYPRALAPGPGLSWQELGPTSAVATMSDSRSTVSLEFRFDESGDVASVFTPARWSRQGGRYVALPWEGRFHDYRDEGGLRRPSRAEVGWYRDKEWCCVWRARVAPAPA